MLGISIDPALTLNLLRVLLALGCMALSGFLLVYFAFGLRSLLPAFALAFPVGLATALLVSNLLGYVVGTPRAFALGLLVVLAVAAAIAFVKRRNYRPLQPTGWLDCGLFLAAGLAVLTLSIVNYAAYPVWDYYVHFWLANSIRFGNFPVMAPGAPMLYAEYHYGGAFLAAMLAHIGQVDSAIAWFFLTPLAATGAYLAASTVAAHVLGSIRRGLLAGLFFSFGAGLPYLIEPARNIHLRWFAPPTAAASDIVVDSLNRLSPNAYSAFPHNLAQPHYLIGWAIVFSTIVLVTWADTSKWGDAAPRARWLFWPFVGALFASVALIEITVFALGLLGWGACVLWRSISRRSLWHLFSFTLAATFAAGLAVIQGGFATTFLFSSRTSDLSLNEAFDIAIVPLPFLFGPPLQHTAHPYPWITLYIILFGLPLIAAPVVLVWALRSKHAMPLVWLAAIGLIGMVFPQIIVYYFNTFVRWMGFGNVALALLLGIGMLVPIARGRHRIVSWTLLVACTALIIGWPLAVSVRNFAQNGEVVLGKSTEDHLTISPPTRETDHIDWISGRPYLFLMGAEARQFLRALPASARVLTNHFPEVPLLIRGFAPHKNVDAFSFTYFRYPAPTYFDALYALDPTAMQEYGITHIVINHKWFVGTPPEVHALLADPRFFARVFSNEDMHEGFAWHHVYEVLPAYYDRQPRTSLDLVRNLEQIVPQYATVYVSPAIPRDIRWALLYALRKRQLASSPSFDNHIDARLTIVEPRPEDQYDYALLIDEPPGDRWLNWGLTPQDLPSTWGLFASERVWHALGVGLYDLRKRDCPNRAFASVPPAQHVPARTTATLNLECAAPGEAIDQESSSLLVTVLSPSAAQVEIDSAETTKSIRVEPGATLIPLEAPGARQLTLYATEAVWVRAQRVPKESANPRSGIPALQVIPRHDNSEISVEVRFFGHRSESLEDQVVWELVKQRLIYEHWWHWSSPAQAGVWRLMLSDPPNHGSRFSFQMDFDTLAPSFSVNDKPAQPPREALLPRNPGEPYVLYFTMFRPGEKALSMPVAWLTYGPEGESTAILAPRFILLDQAAAQD